MQKHLPLTLVCLLAFSGCTRHYVLTLNNGSTVTTTTKPQLKDGSWRFKDAKGEDHFVPRGSVREIAPASSASSDVKNQPVQGPPKKRHWYYLWLA